MLDTHWKIYLFYHRIIFFLVFLLRRDQNFPDVREGSPEEKSSEDHQSQTGSGDETPILGVRDDVRGELKDKSEGYDSTDDAWDEHEEGLSEGDLSLVTTKLDEVEQADGAQKPWYNNVY